MMTHKIVIANSKFANYGKSTSVRYVFEILSSRYPYKVIEPASGIYDPAQDVEAIVEIPRPNGEFVKVGIESQGDPSSRLPQSVQDFLQAKCEIILIATRTKGDTIAQVGLLRNKGWQAIWFDNSTMQVDAYNNTHLKNQDRRLQDQLSRDYGFYVASLIERLVLTGGVI